MKKLTHEEVMKRIKAVHNDDFELLENYVNSRIKIGIRHKCGYQWKGNPRHLMEGHGCPSCLGVRRKTTEDFKSEVKRLTGEEYVVLGEYRANNKPIRMKHLECGLEFDMHPKSFINGQRCPNERYYKSSTSNMYPSDKIEEELKEIYKDEYEIVSGYKGASRKANVKHKKCGRIFTPTPRQLINKKTGCPHCYVSRGEDVIRVYLKERGYSFKEQYRIDECRNKRPLPFDFAIFDNNALMFLIEYDGIQHYQPKFGEENFRRTQLHDRIKNRYCEDKGIPLLRIKYKRSENLKLFETKIIDDLESKLFNMAIPSQAH